VRPCWTPLWARHDIARSHGAREIVPGVDRDPSLLEHAGRRMEDALPRSIGGHATGLSVMRFCARAIAAAVSLRIGTGPRHPVVTAQERALELDLLREIRRVDPGVYTVSYRRRRRESVRGMAAVFDNIFH